jgi:hypothetical protein
MISVDVILFYVQDDPGWKMNRKESWCAVRPFWHRHHRHIWLSKPNLFHSYFIVVLLPLQFLLVLVFSTIIFLHAYVRGPRCLPHPFSSTSPSLRPFLFSSVPLSSNTYNDKLVILCYALGAHTNSNISRGLAARVLKRFLKQGALSPLMFTRAWQINERFHFTHQCLQVVCTHVYITLTCCIRVVQSSIKPKQCLYCLRVLWRIIRHFCWFKGKMT